MKSLSLAALVVALAGAGLASAPALAAAGPNIVPMCESSQTPTALKNSIDTLKATHNSQNIASVDVWNGCLKVIYDTNGHSTTAFYDPDTLSLVGGTSPKQG